MENLLGGVAFALFIAAQVLAVIVMHAPRTEGPSGHCDRKSPKARRSLLALPRYGKGCAPSPL